MRRLPAAAIAAGVGSALPVVLATAAHAAGAEQSDASFSTGLDGDGTIGLADWLRSSANGRRTSLLVEPADGRLPPLTAGAEDLYARGRSTWRASEASDWVSDLDAFERCITRGFPGRHLATLPVGPSAKATERLTRTAPATMAYRLTYEDADVFSAPWTVAFDWTRDDSYRLFEYACHARNTVREAIAASRALRRQAPAR